MIPAHAQDQGLPALTSGNWYSIWGFEVIPALATLAAAILYVMGVTILRRRGDHWSIGRSVAFLVGGLGSIVVATQSFLAVYDTTLLSTHMAQHMLLNMIAPIFLGMGAPITLALRTLGGWPRKALLAVLHSRWLKIVGHPVVAGALFIANPWILYFSGLYELTLEHAWLHDLNHLHFVALGALWFWSLIGVDPMPRASFPMRLIAVFISLPFHAFLGVTLMSASRIIGAQWYLNHPRSWGPTLAQDQYLAGGILWSMGDALGVGVLAVLFVLWARESEREARRVDRELDRRDARVESDS